MTFARPTLQELRDRNIADLGPAAKLRRSPERAMAKAISGTAHGLHGHLDWASRQATPLYCDDDQLAAWGTIFTVPRKQPTKARGSVTLTGTNGTTIAAGTKLQNAAGVRYLTTAEVTISGGSAVVALESDDYGADGNLAVSSVVRLTSPISGVQTDGVVSTAIAGGLDIEPIAEWRVRLLARLRSPRAGGNSSDYDAWVRATPTVDVANVFPRPRFSGFGTMAVFFTVDAANPIPTVDQVGEVLAYVDPLRPCDVRTFSVLAPIAQPVTYTIGLPSTYATAAIKAAIKTSLAALHLAEAAPGETLLLSHIREAISLAVGEVDHTLSAPAGDVVPASAYYLPTFDESLVTFSEYTP